MNTTERLAAVKAQIESDVAKSHPRRRTAARKRTDPPRIQVPEILAAELKKMDPRIVAAEPEKMDPCEAWDRMADLMVARAFEENKDLREAATRPSAVIYIQTELPWLHFVAEAWGRALFPSAPLPIDGDDYDGLRTLGDSDAIARWCEFRRDGIGKRSKNQGTNGLAWALSQGLPTYGFAADLAHLPASFSRVYERHVVIRPPDGDVFRSIVQAITGTAPTIPIDDNICDGITEADLLLAMRPGQTADEYAARVIKLVNSPDAPVQRADITLDDIGGMEAAVAWGRTLVTDIDDYRAGRILWRDVDPGVLLVGPPGTGKTTFAKALAGSTGLPLITGSLAEWQAAGHLGDLLKAMRATFAQARKAAPALLFIDEIDSFSSRAEVGGQHRDYTIQVINALLEEVGGIAGRDGVVVVAACNDASRLDPALLRAGRLDRTIEVGLPSIRDLERILRHHLAGDLADQDLVPVADAMFGRTGADAVQVIRDARRRARSERRQFDVADLVAVVASHAPDVSVSTLRRCAVHEAGHAVANVILRPGNLLGVTVRQTLATGGYTATASDPDFVVAGIAQLRQQMTILLAGRAAEEIVLGNVSAGAGGSKTSDLAKATLLSTLALASFGLAGNLVWRGEVTSDNLEDFLRRHPDLAAQVSAIVEEAYADALTLLRPQMAVIEKLADLLVEHETVGGADVELLVASQPIIGG